MALWDGGLGGEPLPGGGLQHDGGPLAGGDQCGDLYDGPGGEDGGWSHVLSAGGALHGAPQKHGAESLDCFMRTHHLKKQVSSNQE